MEIRKTETFARWLDRLKDSKARAKVLVRITRLADGGTAKASCRVFTDMVINTRVRGLPLFSVRVKEAVVPILCSSTAALRRPT